MESLQVSAAELRGDPAPAPAPFVQPEPGLEPQEYLANGHFTAAVARTSEVIPETDDVATLLALWYVRIQSLLFLQLGSQAAEEASACLAPLEQPELLSTLPTIEAQLDAWKLRLILSPVRTKGINTSTIQQYYALGAEARENAGVGPPEPWLAALKLAGLYTASALIALHDYPTVIDLLAAQYKATNDTATAQLLALIYIHVGDTLSAREWASRSSAEVQTELKTLYKFADSDSENTVPVMSKVYEGRVGEAIAELEELAAAECPSSAVFNARLANLSILYDLCYPNAREHLARISETAAARGNKYLESVDLSTELRRALQPQ